MGLCPQDHATGGRRTWDPSRVSIDVDEDTRVPWELESIRADTMD